MPCSSEVAGLGFDLEQLAGQVFEAADQHMDDRLVALQNSVSHQHGGGAGGLVVTLPELRLDDQVHDARFVFVGDRQLRLSVCDLLCMDDGSCFQPIVQPISQRTDFSL